MTMQPNELRIGNFIKQPNGLNQVFQIDVDTINTYEREYIKPIPLTEEWLVKLGFINVSKTKSKIFQYNSWNIIPDQDSYSFLMEGYDEWSTSVGIEYVHQLQNLYFALTGEELKQQDNGKL